MVSTTLGQQQQADEFIDLTRYLRSIRQRWRIVLLTTLIAVVLGVVGAGVLGAVAPRYLSESTILLTGSKYRLTLDPKFTTVEQSDATAAARSEEYRLIVLGGEVRRDARAALGDKVSDKEFNDARIDVKPKNNIIIIAVTSSSAEKAEQIATAYAQAAVAQLYSINGIVDADQMVLTRKLNEAIAYQQDVETQLEALTKQSKIDMLTIALSQKETQRQGLADQLSVATRARFISYYSYFAAINDLERLGRDTMALRTLATEGRQSPASTTSLGLSLLGLQNRLMEIGASGGSTVEFDKDGRATAKPDASRRPPPATIDISGPAVGGGSADQLIADIDALRRAVDARRTEFLGLVAAGPDAIPGTEASTEAMARLNDEINGIRADLLAANFKKTTLTQQVELATTTRQTLETKVREAGISSTLGDDRVSIVSPAQIPTSPSFPPPLSLVIPLTVVVGFLIGLIIALTPAFGQSREDSARSS